MTTHTIDHDEWALSPAKLPPASKIKLPGIHGVIGFDGDRNPGSRSASSHRVWFTYRVEANKWQPKVGICESSAEWGTALQILLDPNVYDIRFQPYVVGYVDGDGKRRTYTHDIYFQMRTGHQRLVFVRNSRSLEKEKTWRDIEEIRHATLKQTGLQTVVVNADEFNQARRDNLHRLIMCKSETDPIADEAVLEAFEDKKIFRHMRDLFPLISLSNDRVFRSCYRLVAHGALRADLDSVLWEYSRLEYAQ